MHEDWSPPFAQGSASAGFRERFCGGSRSSCLRKGSASRSMKSQPSSPSSHWNEFRRARIGDDFPTGGRTGSIEESKNFSVCGADSSSASDAAACRSTNASSPIPPIAPGGKDPAPGIGCREQSAGVENGDEAPEPLRPLFSRPLSLIAAVTPKPLGAVAGEVLALVVGVPVPLKVRHGLGWDRRAGPVGAVARCRSVHGEGGGWEREERAEADDGYDLTHDVSPCICPATRD